MSHKKTSSKYTLYILVFFFTLHLTPMTYINSSFLGSFVGTERVGLLYALAAIFGILSFFGIRICLKKFGNFRTFLSILIIETIALIVMAISGFAPVVIIAYIIGYSMRLVAFFSMDIFLESASSNKDTGETRGIYMTFLNTAFLIGPFIASFVLVHGDFSKIYLLAAIMQIPSFYLVIRYLKNFKDPIYQKPKTLKALRKMYNNSDLFATFASNFLLRFFYAWMVVYIPIYLNTQMGFTFSEVTLIIGIALLPFVLLEALLGKIADKYIGEKEILGLGFLIIAISTAMISFISVPNLIIWAALLFTTRVGASMIEIMTESHLFKRIDSENINILSLYRTSRPVAYIMATLIASVLLSIIDFKYLFLILGVIMLYGIRYSICMKDTK
jgi:MFS family permease